MLIKWTEHHADGVKVFALGPGAVKTSMTKDLAMDPLLIDDVQLAPWTMVRLAVRLLVLTSNDIFANQNKSGSDNYLSGT